MDDTEAWPPLELAAWKPTFDTLHMWTQIVGKVRLALTPPINHWWHVPLYVAARGLTSSPIPYGDRTFEVTFDLVDHNLYVETNRAERKAMPLLSRSVASFYEEFMGLLKALNIDVHIWRMPVEIPDPIPFDEDTEHATYDPNHVRSFFQVLNQADRALKELEGGFVGKQSPAHFFWGSFDHAQTRYSGRLAPPRPNADKITREAYSHEVISFGFWPGTPGMSDAAFYGYAAPEPPGFNTAVRATGSYYHPKLSEYVLPYVVLRQQSNPRELIRGFFQSVYDAGANLAGWDRRSLDRTTPLPPPGAQASSPAAP
jgi:hypothetical protein